MRGARRFSQAISEGDGISLLAEVADRGAAAARPRSTAPRGSSSAAALHGVREATELPILWCATGSLADAQAAGADAALLVVAGPRGRRRPARAAPRRGARPRPRLRRRGARRGRAAARARPRSTRRSSCSRPTRADDGNALEHVLGLLLDVPAGKLAIAGVPVAHRGRGGRARARRRRRGDRRRRATSPASPVRRPAIGRAGTGARAPARRGRAAPARRHPLRAAAAASSTRTRRASSRAPGRWRTAAASTRAGTTTRASSSTRSRRRSSRRTARRTSARGSSSRCSESRASRPRSGSAGAPTAPAAGWVAGRDDGGRDRARRLLAHGGDRRAAHARRDGRRSRSRSRAGSSGPGSRPGLATSAKYPGVFLAVPLLVAGWGEWRRLAPRRRASPCSRSRSRARSSSSTRATRGTTSRASSGSRAPAGSASSTTIRPRSPSSTACGSRSARCSSSRSRGSRSPPSAARAPTSCSARSSLVYFADLLTLNAHFDRYVLPLIPPLGALAGRFRRLAPVTLALLVLPLVWSLGDNADLRKTDTRAVARRLARARAPGGERVAADPSAPPLRGLPARAARAAGPRPAPRPEPRRRRGSAPAASATSSSPARSPTACSPRGPSIRARRASTTSCARRRGASTGSSPADGSAAPGWRSTACNVGPMSEPAASAPHAPEPTAAPTVARRRPPSGATACSRSASPCSPRAPSCSGSRSPPAGSSRPTSAARSSSGAR